MTRISISRNAPPRAACRQRGLTLVELMVGLTIGLMVVAVATGTLMVTRSVTGSVSDVSTLQQQASYVFRVLGQQIRPAGGVGLATNASSYADGVHLDSSDFDLAAQSLHGIDRPAGRTEFLLSIGQRSDEEPLLSGRQEHLLRNCLGETPSGTQPKVLQSHFRLDGTELKCAGSDPAGAQPIVDNVADFQVRYLTSTSASAPGFQYINAADVGQWPRVVAVEVCLVLYGAERMDFPQPAPGGDDSAAYLGCPTDRDPAPTQCMTQDCVRRTSGAAPVPAGRANRLHMTFRNVYQLRSQGAACLVSPAECA